MKPIVLRGDTFALPRLTTEKLLELAKKELYESPGLIEYWKKTKETIHLFDEIIVKYVIQWSAVLLAMVGASTLIFAQTKVIEEAGTTVVFEYGLIAGIIAITAIFVSIPIAIKCWFYYELLEEALRVAEDIEVVLFEDKKLAKSLGLTHRLMLISTKKLWGTTFFGWTIFLPFIFLMVASSTLTLFYFNVIATPFEIAFSIFMGFVIIALAVFVYKELYKR